MSKKVKAKQEEPPVSNMAEDIVIPKKLPVLPAKELVPFPSVMVSLYVARPQSMRAIEQAMNSNRLVFLVSQENQEVEDPKAKDLYEIGVVAHIVRTLQAPDGRQKVLLQGICRAKAVSYDPKKDIFSAEIKKINSNATKKLSAANEAIMNRIREHLQLLVEYEHLPEELLLVTEEVSDPGVLSDIILAYYKLDLAYAQSILEELDPIKRLHITESIVSSDLNQFIVNEKIKDKARDEMNKGQRDYYLREQLKQIQKELGEEESSNDDLLELGKRLKQCKLPKEANAEATKQYKRLEKMSQESSEYALLRTYLEWFCDVPWNKETKDLLDLKKAKKILDTDHFGLEKVKDRIIEYLSVKKLNPKSKGSILCFVGPPGVGKTSLGRSIAKALGREFVHMSLGGVRDEAEIRGHRRTYVGALPGRIIQGLKTAGSKNPVFVLDELDKLGNDFRGDPASALLEVLDPSQNSEFNDHYLNIPYDLSHVLFVATANTLDTVPDALMDRLETIFIPGYTAEEKVEIAKRYLIPRKVEESGLKVPQFVLKDASIMYLIDRYTREAGVRTLDRKIAALCRKIARKVAEGGTAPKDLQVSQVAELLGPPEFDPEMTEEKEDTGLVQGLAWTVHGGEVMPIEASIAKGSGQLQLTGQLGNVMQESAQAALFFARANAGRLGLDTAFHAKQDMHIHVPGGATPKDGPSAGITIATALVSALSGRKVAKDVAMTGEMTLRGNVLAVGGLREKALAALRHGIVKVIIPFENVKDLEEIPPEQRKKIQFIPVKHINEVLELVLRGKKKVPLVRAKGKTTRGREARV